MRLSGKDISSGNKDIETSAFKNMNWIDYFDDQVGSLASIGQPTLESLSWGDLFQWVNYFDVDLPKEPAFRDLFTEDIKWTDCFSSDQVYLPQIDAFSCKEDWFQWDDFCFGLTNWKSLPPLPSFELKLLWDEKDEEVGDTELEWEHSDVSESLPDSKIFQKSPKSIPMNPVAEPTTTKPEPPETFLTKKSYDWLASITYTATAVSKFRKNVHDTRVTKSAGWEPNVQKLPPPEIIEPSRSPNNSPEPLSDYSSNFYEDDPGSISQTDLDSVPEIRKTLETDSNISSKSNFTTPTISPDLTLPVLPLLKPFDPNKQGNRPHSSQGLYFQSPNPHFSDSGGGTLLQVPSNYCTNRRTSEPSLPKLEPPKRLKTPTGLINNSKFWAVRRNKEQWDNFDKPSTSKSQLKKLKKLPRSRCRSALEAPTSFNVDEFGGGSCANLISTPEGSPKGFRFRQSSRSGRVSPGCSSDDIFRQGIQSKLKPKKPRNLSKNGRVSFFKRREWLPVLRNLLKVSLLRPQSSAKVQPNSSTENLLDSESENIAGYFNPGIQNEAGTSSPYNVIKYKPVAQDPKSNIRESAGSDWDLRRRPYWVQFLRYCNFRKRLGIRRSRSRNNFQQGNRAFLKIPRSDQIISNQ